MVHKPVMKPYFLVGGGIEGAPSIAMTLNLSLIFCNLENE